MTWKEFVANVERQIVEQGGDLETLKISYIDICDFSFEVRKNTGEPACQVVIHEGEVWVS